MFSPSSHSSSPSNGLHFNNKTNTNLQPIIQTYKNNFLEIIVLLLKVFFEIKKDLGLISDGSILQAHYDEQESQVIQIFDESTSQDEDIDISEGAENDEDDDDGAVQGSVRLFGKFS